MRLIIWRNLSITGTVVGNLFWLPLGFLVSYIPRAVAIAIAVAVSPESPQDDSIAKYSRNSLCCSFRLYPSVRHRNPGIPALKAL